jgi:membrane associated rhomboid family serine protease
MPPNSAKANRSVLPIFRKLAISLPANLFVSWYVLRDNALEVAVFGAVGGLAGALLLTALER